MRLTDHAKLADGTSASFVCTAGGVGYTTGPLVQGSPKSFAMDPDSLEALSKFSHELRNLLTTIKGRSELLLEDLTSDPSQSDVKAIILATQRMEALIDSYAKSVRESQADSPSSK
jgi:hypothetical protein